MVDGFHEFNREEDGAVSLSLPSSLDWKENYGILIFNAAFFNLTKLLFFSVS